MREPNASGHNTASTEGRIADNIVFFARALRKAGLRVGPAAVTDSIQAVLAAGIGSREDFYWTLHSVLVNRREDHAVFDEAFRLFWRSRGLIEKMLAMLSPVARAAAQKEKPRAGQTRASEAFANLDRQEWQEQEVEVDARLSVSAREVLRQKDFAQMTAEELAEARKAIAALLMPHDLVVTRRFRPDPRGARIDPRAMMRFGLRTGGDLLLPRYRSPRRVHPPVVVLADISGSMSQYTRIFLHFLHALTERRRRVHSFVFGTRLTNLTRQLRHRDPDEALAQCAGAVKDWSGGTRIGEAIGSFNRLWSRRVLGQGAIVLLITDGLERDDVETLGREMERLQKSCRRLVWLNPLLRFEGFEPRARGVRAMLPYVDELRPVHNLEALSDLCAALSAAPGRGTRLSPAAGLGKRVRA
ncbi:VWA domain-containing protein [Chelativorans sp. SCAU2101]|uniref:VWA domain-containing protein n=1 Tax=Chelativorans petroleitrophicus TaxID=2975484 RepID=A0A9X3B9W4_9HYPH|nr:VWA domain-containing protein [Chelativorans petroleitrophicus]MCT8990996.1 VWA domain-containing protein [Chelativorans petroleitrophicus]